MANSKFSRFVYSVIDMAGLNDDIKNKRKKCIKQFECIPTKVSTFGEEKIYTGSTSEGTSVLFVSDVDLMNVLDDFICVDDSNADTNNMFDILEAEYDNMPPGYVKVRHCISNINRRRILCRLAQSYWYGSTSATPYISNKYLIEITLNKLRENNHQFSIADISNVNMNGPAGTCGIYFDETSHVQSFDTDFVLAIPFYNSSILTEWSSRSRHYDWPSKELIHDVSTLRGFILPVGGKKSETQHLEWRISHVTAEKKLLLSFNSTQDKMHVILKLFSKKVFTKVCKSFSSYMVKNVVLWMAEINPWQHFTPDLLIAQILQSLTFIKQCLICNHLPSYMIPTKNLIAARIFGHERRELILLLSSLIEEGAFVIYRLPKLAECINYVSIHPDIFTEFYIWRHRVETQYLIYLCTFHSSITEDIIQSDFDNTYFDNNLHYHIRKLYQDPRHVRELFSLINTVLQGFQERVSLNPFNEIKTEFTKRFQWVRDCLFLK